MKLRLVRWSAFLALLAAALMGHALPTVRADAIASADAQIGSKIVPLNVKGIKGQGAVAVSAQVGGKGDGKGAKTDPLATDPSRTFSDQDTIGPAGKTVRSVKDTKAVFLIGQDFRSAYPTQFKGLNATDIGRSILYTVEEGDKVVEAAKAAPLSYIQKKKAIATNGNISSAVGAAEQTVTVGAKGTVDVTGKARATVQTNNNDPGFGVGIVHDPITFELLDPDAGSASLSIFLTSDFFLEASQPLSFASAFHEIGTNLSDDPDAETLRLSFAIHLDYLTASLEDVVIKVLSFDASVFTSPTFAFDFEESLRELFQFDATAHRLTVKGGDDILLDLVEVGATPLTLRVDYGAIAGVSPVPEPSTLVLFGVGVIGALGMARRSRRQQAEM